MPGIIIDAALAARFWEKVRKGEGCWEWAAHRNRQGYREFWAGGKLLKAHRASWLIHHGPVPAGLCTLHKCDNPSCVRPENLKLGTNDDNVADKMAKGRHRYGHLKDGAHGQSKLRETDIVLIQWLPLRQLKLAALFGVSQATISNIKRRERWKHIP